MYPTLVICFCFLTATFAGLTTRTSNSVPDFDENKFVRYGDIFELNPKYARRRNLVVGESKLWDDGVVPYFIDKGLEQHRDKLVNAMNHISDRTCIRFRPKSDNDRGYIYIYRGRSCAALVGRLDGEVPVSLPDGCEKLVSAAHEIMHTLGVHHTQCRSDRDDYITVHYDNIEDSLRRNFRKLDESENQLLVPFDFDSIMLYGPYMGSKNGNATITANDPNQVFLDTHEKNGMSELDIKALNKLYNCERFGPEYAYDD